jgi:hypothetical protein
MGRVASDDPEGLEDSQRARTGAVMGERRTRDLQLRLDLAGRDLPAGPDQEEDDLAPGRGDSPRRYSRGSGSRFGPTVRMVSKPFSTMSQ